MMDAFFQQKFYSLRKVLIFNVILLCCACFMHKHEITSLIIAKLSPSFQPSHWHRRTGHRNERQKVQP